MAATNTLARTVVQALALGSVLSVLPGGLAEANQEKTDAEEGNADLKRQVQEQAKQLEELTARLDAQSTGEEQTVAEPLLRIYGFTDAGLDKIFMRGDDTLLQVVPSAASTFVLGNINLYLDARVSSSWRTLVEFRLTNYPDGAETTPTPGNPSTRTSTETFDQTNPSGGWSRVRLGSTILERAQIEWQANDLFGLRVGLFLTPFGIWNMDHGTPTLLSLMLPQFEIQQTFPNRQIGLMAFGQKSLSTWRGGYYATLSNGRTPGQLDLTEDKMVGGRLWLSGPPESGMTLGTSFVAGRYSDRSREIQSYVPVRIRSVETVAYSEYVGGADLSWNHGPLRVRSEFAGRRIKFAQGKRALQWGQPGVFERDRTEWNWYLLVARSLPFWGLEPYGYVEVARWPTPLGDGLLIPSLGFNVHFTAQTQLKIQSSYTLFYSDLSNFTRTDQSDIRLSMRLVLAF